MQGLLIENELRGKFGADFVDFLSPYVGLFGLWILWFMLTLLGIVVFMDKSTSEMINIMYDFTKKKLKAVPKPRMAFKEDTQKKIYQKTSVETNQKVVKEEAPVEEIFAPIEDLIEKEEEIDKPAYLRKQEKAVKKEETSSDYHVELSPKQ